MNEAHSHTTPLVGTSPKYLQMCVTNLPKDIGTNYASIYERHYRSQNECHPGCANGDRFSATFLSVSVLLPTQGQRGIGSQLCAII